MKNKLADLNDHLFAQLERLSEEGMPAERIELEVKRGEAIVAVADQVIRNAALQVAAAKLVAEHGDKVARRMPLMLENGNAIEAKPQ
jgi:hypothetical protein